MFGPAAQQEQEVVPPPGSGQYEHGEGMDWEAAFVGSASGSKASLDVRGGVQEAGKKEKEKERTILALLDQLRASEGRLRSLVTRSLPSAQLKVLEEGLQDALSTLESVQLVRAELELDEAAQASSRELSELARQDGLGVWARLPSELVQRIAGWMPLSSIGKLALVSQAMNETALPSLYRVLDLRDVRHVARVDLLLARMKKVMPMPTRTLRLSEDVSRYGDPAALLRVLKHVGVALDRLEVIHDVDQRPHVVSRTGFEKLGTLRVVVNPQRGGADMTPDALRWKALVNSDTRSLRNFICIIDRNSSTRGGGGNEDDSFSLEFNRTFETQQELESIVCRHDFGRCTLTVTMFDIFEDDVDNDWRQRPHLRTVVLHDTHSAADRLLLPFEQLFILLLTSPNLVQVHLALQIDDFNLEPNAAAPPAYNLPHLRILGASLTVLSLFATQLKSGQLQALSIEGQQTAVEDLAGRMDLLGEARFDAFSITLRTAYENAEGKLVEVPLADLMPAVVGGRKGLKHLWLRFTDYGEVEEPQQFNDAVIKTLLAAEMDESLETLTLPRSASCGLPHGKKDRVKLTEREQVDYLDKLNGLFKALPALKVVAVDNQQGHFVRQQGALVRPGRFCRWLKGDATDSPAWERMFGTAWRHA